MKPSKIHLQDLVSKNVFGTYTDKKNDMVMPVRVAGAPFKIKGLWVSKDLALSLMTADILNWLSLVSFGT
jgi:hypothetical protein